MFTDNHYETIIINYSEKRHEILGNMDESRKIALEQEQRNFDAQIQQFVIYIIIYY